MRGTPLAAVAVGVALALTTRAEAHQTSVKYVELSLDGARAHIQLTVAPGDVTEPLGLPPDARPGVGEAACAPVAAYVSRWLEVSPDGGAACTASRIDAKPDADARFVVVTWDVACAAPLDALALDLRAFFAVDRRHEAFVTVRRPGASPEVRVVRAEAPVLRLAAGARGGFGTWIAAGADHIWDGRDHVSFVLALLLAVVLARRDGAWETRRAGPTLRATAGIVTAFTVAHSASLAAASLGWVQLPSRAVEALIAVSILYTAIENVVRPDARTRLAVTFGFGLVHGLGFASVLGVMLPPDRVAAPLLGFNLGVELGQLAVVAVALPVAWAAARALGADRYRRRALPASSLAIGVIALGWLLERTIGLSLTGALGM